MLVHFQTMFFFCRVRPRKKEEFAVFLGIGYKVDQSNFDDFQRRHLPTLGLC
jgi:hypothetical protein